MTWKCPACQVEILHDQSSPQSGQRYRCQVCRIEMTFDEAQGQMKVLLEETPPPIKKRFVRR